jgi:hypothetical protein
MPAPAVAQPDRVVTVPWPLAISRDVSATLGRCTEVMDEISSKGTVPLNMATALSDDAEIDAAFAARQAMESLDDNGRRRVIAWLAAGLGLALIPEQQ